MFAPLYIEQYSAYGAQILQNFPPPLPYEYVIPFTEDFPAHNTVLPWRRFLLPIYTVIAIEESTTTQTVVDDNVHAMIFQLCSHCVVQVYSL